MPGNIPAISGRYRRRISILLHPLPVDKINLVFDFPVCIAACVVAVVPTIISGKFRKWQGIALLSIYGIYMAMLILMEVGVFALV